MFYHKKMPNHVAVSEKISETYIAIALYTAGSAEK